MNELIHSPDDEDVPIRSEQHFFDGKSPLQAFRIDAVRRTHCETTMSTQEAILYAESGAMLMAI
jgi:hypothetical protein